MATVCILMAGFLVNFVIEFLTTRATSFIFLLGVGSYLCYKFYLQLRRRFTKRNPPEVQPSTPSSGKSSGFHRSISRRSSSQWSTCDRLLGDGDSSFDPDNFELRYFGPDHPSDEATSILTDFSEDVSFPSSLIYSDSDYGVDSCRSSNKATMGNFNSRFSEPVFYNVDTGIHFREPPDQRTRRIAQQLQSVLSPTRSKKLTETLNNLANKQASSSLLQRPNHLPVDNLYHKNNESLPHNDRPLKTEVSGLSYSSNYNDSSAFPSEMESLCGSWSYDDQASSHNGSLKGNFSPASLRQKFFKMNSSDLSPDRSESSSRFYMRENSIDSYTEAGSDCSGKSSCIRTSGGESLSYGGLTREISVDSYMSDDTSELSSLEPISETIAVETFESFKDLENEVVNLKHALMELDSELLNMQAGKPLPLFSSLGYYDTYDGSGNNSDSSLSSKSAVAFVQLHKDRITNRGLLDSSSSGTINDRRRSSVSPNIASSSTPQSHECSSFSESEKSSSQQRAISLPITPLSMVDADSMETDSGSDFGQSLTSDSPRRMPTPIIRKKLRKHSNTLVDSSVTSLTNNNSSKCFESASPERFDSNTAKCSLRTSMVSSESGFLDGMINSMDSPNDDVVDASYDEVNSQSELKGFETKKFSVDSLTNIEEGPNIEQYIGENSSQFSAEAFVKLKKVISSSPQSSASSSPPCLLHKITADKVGVIRAVTFLALSCQKETDGVFSSSLLKDVTTDASIEKHPWLKKWYFLHDANDQSSNNFHRKVEDCMSAVQDVRSALRQQSSIEKKTGSILTSLFNGDNMLEAKIIDAVRLGMMMSAIRLFDVHCVHPEAAISDGPLFPFLLFAQKHTSNPENYYENHLKYVGTNVSPTELDLYLLSYSLGITTNILSLSATDAAIDDQTHANEPNHFKYYPDWKIGVSPEITLIADKKFYLCCST